MPGENSWVKDLFSTPDVYFKDQPIGDVRTSQKRGRDDPSTDPEVSLHYINITSKYLILVYVVHIYICSLLF